MIDHVTRHSKDEDKLDRSQPSRNVNKSDENKEGSYYYDDSSNYEVYQDDDDEVDDSAVGERCGD